MFCGPVKVVLFLTIKFCYSLRENRNCPKGRVPVVRRGTGGREHEQVLHRLFHGNWGPAGDFLYGIFFKDRLSVLVGAIMVILTIYVARKQKKSTKEETVPGQNNDCGKEKTP